MKKTNKWLAEAEKLVQSFNKLRSNLDEKKSALEQFQGQLEGLYDWQKEMDVLNEKAQVRYLLYPSHVFDEIVRLVNTITYFFHVIFLGIAQFLR